MVAQLAAWRFKELFKDEILEAENQGQEKLGLLIAKLIKAGRTDDALRASTDKEYKEHLFTEFQMT